MALFKRKKKTEEESQPAEKKDIKEKKVGEKKKEEGKSMKDLYQSQSDSSSRKDSGKSFSKKEEDKKVETKEKKEETFSIYPQAYKVLLKPLVTEKISNLGAQNKYAFQVALDANKVEIAKAIRGVYGVEPKKVNIIRMEGKRVRVGMIRGQRKDWKKAIITLPKGKTINVYEGL